MKLYKLTKSDFTTRNETKWGDGVTHEAVGDAWWQDLCSDAWIHAYEHPLIAVFLDPIHGDFGANAVLWECEGEPGKRDGQLKLGCRKLTTLRRIDKPAPTTIQRVRFGIGCALSVYSDASFVTWAEKWLSGEDRSVAWSQSVEMAAWSAARSAEDAAWSAARAVGATRTVYAAEPAAAAEAAVRSLRGAIEARPGLDLIQVAKWAMTDSTVFPDDGQTDRPALDLSETK